MRGAAADVSTSPPAAKKPKVVVNFRCNADNEAWAQEFAAKPGASKFSEICDWIFGMGRLHFESMHQYEEDLQKVARADGTTEAQAIAKIVRLGLAAHERERKLKK